MITIIAFFFVLSLLVFVHELGHYIVAKLGGIGVERFSIGYPPRLFGKKIGETDYCISAIPFGGYVKLTGMDDFSAEEQEDAGVKDFRGKSAPVRMAVLFAGSFMNLLTAVIIFFFIFLFNGIPENSTVIGYVEPGSLASQIGIKPGDEFIAVNGKKKTKIEEFLVPLYSGKMVALTIKSDGVEKTVTVPRLLAQEEDFGILPFMEAKVGGVLGGTPAEKAGIKAGDIIKQIGGEPVNGWYHMSKIIRANPGKEMPFTVVRNGADVQVTVKIGEDMAEVKKGVKEKVGKIGVSMQSETRKAGIAESFISAIDKTIFVIGQMLDFVYKLITFQMSSKLLGGPVMIAQLAGESAKSGLTPLMSFTAFISLNLGVLNLLPLPALDGGHILITLIESVSRRKLSIKIKMAVQQAGIAFLLFLMLYVTFNDLMRMGG